MLTIEPEYRLSAEEVLQHEWFSLTFSEEEHQLLEVLDDLDKRKSLKSNGELGLSQLIKVENIDEEILKKGLEISSKLQYTKSYAFAAKRPNNTMN